ncbi:MAG: ABC transporter permease [Dehalococcoidia bacterium]|nr:ABC transporter permease [Dehalococcoidia bacterium]
MATQTIAKQLKARTAGQSLWGIAAHRLIRRPKALIAIGLLAALYSSGIFANLIAPYGYTEQDLAAVRQGPSTEHLLGTDTVGRDVLSRLVFAMRSNLVLTFASVITGSLLIGITLGLVAGYYGKLVDAVIMRVGEVFLAFPGILLMILMAATLKPRILDLTRAFEDATGIQGLVRWGLADYLVIFAALATVSWVGMARLVRGQVLYLKKAEYVESARALGASTRRILFIHLLPNALPPVIVSASMGLGAIAGAEVALSWLGIGIQPPVPSLGNMIREGQHITMLRNHPHLILPPVIVVGVLIYAWNLLGDALNDVLNPRAR